jgi:hypothetical protein
VNVSAELLETLLVESLRAWRIEGTVRRSPEGPLLVEAGHVSLRVERCDPAAPFRWMVASGERRRPAASVAGVLRALRAAVDPSHRPLRPRFAPRPIIAP